MKLISAMVGVLLVLAACDPNTPPAQSATTAADGGVVNQTDQMDSDLDGVPDQDDQCPDQKEDGLGAKPHDGCPNGRH